MQRLSSDLLRALELTRFGLDWFPIGFMVAPTWFGQRLSRATNDEHYGS